MSGESLMRELVLPTMIFMALVPASLFTARSDYT